MRAPHITRVLVFGLLVANATLAASAEHRSSASTRVSAAGGSSPVHEQPLPLPRLGLGAATGADGRVYTIGGNGPENERDPNNEHDLGVVEAYDPTSNTWTCSRDDASAGCATHSLAPLPTPRHGFVVVAGADGRLYVIGGADVSGTLQTVEAYDPTSNTWACSRGDAASSCATHNLAPLPTPRHGFVVVAGADGHLYVIGGADVSGPLQTVEAYDPTSNTWACSTDDTSSGCATHSLAPLPTPRHGFVVVAGADGRLYVISGADVSGPLQTVEAYDPTSNTWACST